MTGRLVTLLRAWREARRTRRVAARQDRARRRYALDDVREQEKDG